MRFVNKFCSAGLSSLGLLFFLQMVAPGSSNAQTLAWLWDDDKTKLGKKVAGEWQQGTREFNFQSGAMSFLRTGAVFASYEPLDSETIRLRRDVPDSNWDWIVKVKFPASNKMVWYRVQSGNLKEWWSFERIEATVKKREELENLKAEVKALAEKLNNDAAAINRESAAKTSSRIVSVNAEDLTVIWKYHVPSYVLGSAQKAALQQESRSMKNNVVEKLCGGATLRVFRRGITYAYEYYDRDGAYLADLSFNISLQDCSQAGYK